MDMKIKNIQEFQSRFSKVLQEVKEYVDEGEALEYVMFEYVEEINLFFELVNNDTMTDDGRVYQYNNQIEEIWGNTIDFN